MICCSMDTSAIMYLSHPHKPVLICPHLNQKIPAAIVRTGDQSPRHPPSAIERAQRAGYLPSAISYPSPIPSAARIARASAPASTPCVSSTERGRGSSTSKVAAMRPRSEEHTSELQSPTNLVCRLLLEKK